MSLSTLFQSWTEPAIKIKCLAQRHKTALLGGFKPLHRSRKFQGGPKKILSSKYFTEGCMDLPQEAIGPKGSNCFFRGVRTSISKEHIK